MKLFLKIKQLLFCLATKNITDKWFNLVLEKQHKTQDVGAHYQPKLAITCLSWIADNIFCVTTSWGWLQMVAVPLLVMWALQADIIWLVTWNFSNKIMLGA